MIRYLSFDEPLNFVIWICAILIAISIHEFAHAWAAYYLGDHTAERQGRLTLNPLVHLDFMGTLFLILVGFGWGKPVPYNPHNLKNQKYGEAIVSAAGPLSNLLLAIVSSVILRLMLSYSSLDVNNLGLQFLALVAYINIILMVFNLIPLPPLDGSKILFTFLPRSMDNLRALLEQNNIFLVIFLLFLIMSGILPLAFITFNIYGLLAGLNGFNVLIMFLSAF